MKFLAGLLGPAIDDDEDDDQGNAPQGLLSSPVVQHALATGLLGYDGAAAQQASATGSGPDDPLDADAVFPVPFNPLVTLQGILGPNHFIDSNADMQERRRDVLAAPAGGAADAPTLSLGDDELARENYVLRNKAPPPSPFDLERQYKRDNVSPAVPQFVDHGRPQDVSTPSLEVLNRIARDAGLDIGQLQVTSGPRTAAEQAGIMYGPLAANRPQDLADYGKPGQELIGIFNRGRAAGDSPRTIQEKMAQRAQELLDRDIRVSNHMGDPRELNVFDIGLSSVPAEKREAFQAALNAAKARGDLREVLSPYTPTKDPRAFHLEIHQPTLRANMNTALQNQLFRQWELQRMNANER